MDFSNLTILCVGDVMLDRYLHGEIERISPEAPVPVIRILETRDMPGGAGNVARNVASLGGTAILIGLVGLDDAGQRLDTLLAADPRIRAALVPTPGRPTICKSRFVAGRQQVVRADEESRVPLDPAEEQALIAAISARAPEASALILSDYGKGALSPAVIRAAIAVARTRAIPVFVDPKSANFTRYRGATCITPNAREFAAAAAAPAGTEAEIAAAGRPLLAAAEAGAILVTRSERGMTLIEAGHLPVSVPARARAVFDVSGAGDTVIAALALAHAGGRTLAQSMHIANAAAGIVVSKPGTATATIAEVLHELAAGDETGAQSTPGLQSSAQAAELVRHWKEQGLAVGFTNGCFDILHPGHVALLAAARAACDRLVVALNTDASVRRLKGPTRPVNALAARAQVMAAIRYTDCVVAFDEDTPLELIRALAPDVLVKGADYTIDNVVGADLVPRVVLAELVPGVSTTGIISRLGGVEAT